MHYVENIVVLALFDCSENQVSKYSLPPTYFLPVKVSLVRHVHLVVWHVINNVYTLKVQVSEGECID